MSETGGREDQTESNPNGIPRRNKKNRVAIRSELRILDDQKAYADANRKPKIIKAGNYTVGPDVLIGEIEKPFVVPTENPPKPHIQPLQDEITHRIQASQVKTSK